MFRPDHRPGQQPLLEASDDQDRGRRPHRASPPGGLLASSPDGEDYFRARTPTGLEDARPLRPTFSRRSTMRSRSPGTNARLAAKKKYTYAALCLVASLVSFTVQTELAAYVQNALGWDKAYCMLYLTHGSWSLLWPIQLLFLRLRSREPWPQFWRRHKMLIRS